MSDTGLMDTPGAEVSIALIFAPGASVMIGVREVISVPSSINSVIVQMWGLKPSGDPQPGSDGYSLINLSMRLIFC